MKRLYTILIIGFALLSFSGKTYKDSCSVMGIYSAESLSFDSYVLDEGYDEVKEGYHFKILSKMKLASGLYKVDIHKKGSDWYQVGYKNIYIRTSGCYMYSSEVILDWQGSFGTITER